MLFFFLQLIMICMLVCMSRVCSAYIQGTILMLFLFILFYNRRLFSILMFKSAHFLFENKLKPFIYNDKFKVIVVNYSSPLRCSKMVNNVSGSQRVVAQTHDCSTRDVLNLNSKKKNVRILCKLPTS